MSRSPDLIASVPGEYLRPIPSDSLVYSPSLAGEIPTGPSETLEARTAVAALTGLVFAACNANKARVEALSWRGYKVGATAAMVDFRTGGLGYFGGYNIKPLEGDDGINLHAEQIAIAKGRFRGLSRLIGIAIVADPQDLDANPMSLPTLRPCSRCEAMFARAPEVDERTLILGTNPGLTVCEIYSFGVLTGSARSSGVFTQSPFALATESDLDAYDYTIQPSLIGAINKMYSLAA